jgi:hypothetical protein
MIETGADLAGTISTFLNSLFQDPGTIAFLGLPGDPLVLQPWYDESQIPTANEVLAFLDRPGAPPYAYYFIMLEIDPQDDLFLDSRGSIHSGIGALIAFAREPLEAIKALDYYLAALNVDQDLRFVRHEVEPIAENADYRLYTFWPANAIPRAATQNDKGLYSAGAMLQIKFELVGLLN